MFDTPATPSLQPPGPDADEPTPALYPPAGVTGRERLRAVAEVLLCSSVPTQLGLTLLLAAFGWSIVDEAGGLSLSFVVTLSLADTLVLVALMALLTRARGEHPRDLWLGRRPVGRELVLGVLLIPLVFGLAISVMLLVQALAPSLQNVAENPFGALASSPGNAAALGLVAVIAGGVREELQRAFLLRHFERYLFGPVVGVVVLSVAFGLGHAAQGWNAALATGTLGLFWALAYLRRRSVVALVVSHAGFNAIEVFLFALLGAAA